MTAGKSIRLFIDLLAGYLPLCLLCQSPGRINSIKQLAFRVGASDFAYKLESACRSLFAVQEGKIQSNKEMGSRFSPVPVSDIVLFTPTSAFTQWTFHTSNNRVQFQNQPDKPSYAAPAAFTDTTLSRGNLPGVGEENVRYTHPTYHGGSASFP